MWQEISLDFVTGLPLVKGKSVSVVVVDRLSKYCHLGSLPASYSTTTVSEFFVENIIKLHGIPSKMVSDRGKVFLSKFWCELFNSSGTTLSFSMAYHPETDGQTKVVNKTIEGYLRQRYRLIRVNGPSYYPGRSSGTIRHIIIAWERHPFSLSMADLHLP